MATRRDLLRSAIGTAAAVAVPIKLGNTEVKALPPSPTEVGFLLQFPEGVTPPYTCGDIVRYGHGAESYLQQFEVIEVHLDSIRVVKRW